MTTANSVETAPRSVRRVHRSVSATNRSTGRFGAWAVTVQAPGKMENPRVAVDLDGDGVGGRGPR